MHALALDTPCLLVDVDDAAVAVRDGRADAVWPIAARGKLT